ncbi:hypothetical protein KRR55_08095 [Paeniglutamicibacter sp. ABSL32-1]|uniref:hypothetical protein n=1 Tax=Paeniglutamicibacter quisquiliarum TaxID=2849498 RepID=UPI001C2DC9D6|nr:hypothetical protein [Paeniglutamicibacter quisquiliarum]MBV1779070.1 hypothetical protein [Paeniglutamicibacter quisquiliarum]
MLQGEAEMDTGTELFSRLSEWCKEHRHSVRIRKQWKNMAYGAAEEIHRELVVRGFTPLSERRLRRIAANADWWWWKQNSRSSYGRARSRHDKGNPVKPTVLDTGID